MNRDSSDLPSIIEEGNQENISTDGEKKSVMNNYSTSFNDQQDAPGFGGG